MSLIATHPERNVIRVQLRQNVVLKGVPEDAIAALEPLLSIIDVSKSEFLLHQGVWRMEQYFILDGILKRVVANAQAREMILRFAAERDIETSYAAWRLKTPAPYSIVSVTRARVARLSLPQWAAFIDAHRAVKDSFEYEVMRLMSEIMAHIITLHLLDGPGRVHRFFRKQPELVSRIPQKELASYLNLAPESLSRLKHQGKI
jgi:CRP-like cAMP-binding protein